MKKLLAGGPLGRWGAAVGFMSGLLLGASVSSAQGAPPGAAKKPAPAAGAAAPASPPAGAKASAPAAKTAPAAAAKSPGAAGAPAAKPAPAKPLPKDAQETVDALNSPEGARIEAALNTVKNAGKNGKMYTPAVVNRLRDGLPRELTKRALEALAALEEPAAADAGQIYLEHRDVEVRLAAVKCLGASKGPQATQALRGALGDLDARVHSLAATLLGNAKATESVPDLVLALDKGVTSAAVSIGMLCDPKSCDALLDRLKSKPFDVISSGLQQVLARKDIPDETKKKVITAVRELASQKAREFLQDVKHTWPPNGSKAIADTLDKAIKDLEGASK